MALKHVWFLIAKDVSIASVRSYMMKGNCGRWRLKGNSALILIAGRSGWWIETELQNRFQLKCEMEFGILGSDDGLAEFSGWKESFWGYG